MFLDILSVQIEFYFYIKGLVLLCCVSVLIAHLLFLSFTIHLFTYLVKRFDLTLLLLHRLFFSFFDIAPVHAL